MKLRAVLNEMYLEMLKENDLSTSRILLPDHVKAPTRWGRVLSVGEGVYGMFGTLHKNSAKVGDVVYLMNHGKEYVHDAGTYKKTDDFCVSSELDALAVLEDRETMRIKPFGSFIEIEPIEVPDTTEGGIILSDGAKFTPNVGVVKTLGMGAKSVTGEPIPFSVAVGEKIAYPPFKLMKIDFSVLGSSRSTYLIREGDIFGIVENE